MLEEISSLKEESGDGSNEDEQPPKLAASILSNRCFRRTPETHHPLQSGCDDNW